MKRFMIVFALVGLLTIQVLSTQAAPQTSFDKEKPTNPAKGTPIADQYIVVLKEGVDAQAIATALGVKPKHLYKAVLNGFASKLTAAQVEALRGNPNVEYVEQDQEVTTSDTQYGPVPNLDRIDQRYLPLSNSYSYPSLGAGVYAYIIDSGLQAGHSDFTGRAQNVYDVFGGSGADCNGHGTHVAGTVGGNYYGVAKSVNLRGVRVLDCNGSGSTSGVIAGVDWVRLYGQRPAVANLSLGGGYNASLNTAVTNLVNAGVFTAVAAGNNGANACNYSPSSALDAVTVASSNVNDYRASSSNYGGCVDIYAPGVDVTSTWPTNTYRRLSGTSMASPHVAGAGAIYKSLYGEAASSSVASWIINNATTNVIYNNPSGTPNRLLFIPNDTTAPAPTAVPYPTEYPVDPPPTCPNCQIP